MNMRSVSAYGELRTFTKLRTGAALSPHEIPHTERPVLPNGESDLTRWMDRNSVYASLVSFQRA